MTAKNNRISFDTTYGDLWVTGTVNTATDEVVSLALNNVDLSFDIYDLPEGILDSIEDDILDQYYEYARGIEEEKASANNRNVTYSKKEI